MAAMTPDEAFELACLRITEDSVLWSVAYAEYRQLLGGASIRDTMGAGRRLQAEAEARDKGCIVNSN